jgi:hypothetical protein
VLRVNGARVDPWLRDLAAVCLAADRGSIADRYVETDNCNPHD